MGGLGVLYSKSLLFIKKLNYMENDINIESVKNCIDYFIKNESDKDFVLQCLSKSKKLNNLDKNLIYVYLFPRQLLDRELITRIEKYRNGLSNSTGFLYPNYGEITLLIEAYRTQQYSRYIKHLFHSFIKEDGDNVFPINGEGEHECGLCGKRIFEFTNWTNNYSINDNHKEFLSFGSSSTEISLCLDCLVQLKTAFNLLSNIEGVDFLDWKRLYEVK